MTKGVKQIHSLMIIRYLLAITKEEAKETRQIPDHRLNDLNASGTQVHILLWIFICSLQKNPHQFIQLHKKKRKKFTHFYIVARCLSQREVSQP